MSGNHQYICESKIKELYRSELYLTIENVDQSDNDVLIFFYIDYPPFTDENEIRRFRSNSDLENGMYYFHKKI